MSDLENLRKEINDIDDKIVLLMEKRMCVAARIAQTKAARIAQTKKEANVAVRDEKREKDVVLRLKKNCGARFLPYIDEFYQTVFKISRSSQNEIIEGEKTKTGENAL